MHRKFINPHVQINEQDKSMIYMHDPCSHAVNKLPGWVLMQCSIVNVPKQLFKLYKLQ
jgi:hypothetical protein